RRSAELHVDRHRRDPVGGGLPLVGAHGVGVPVGGEDGAGLVGVQPGLGREPDEGVVVGDRLALGEVAAEEALLHRLLHAAFGGEVEQAVGVEGVAAAGAVEVGLPAVTG